jgi:hypothetical protein
VSFQEFLQQGLEVGSQLGPAAAVAAGVAALVFLVCGWPWKRPHARRTAVGAVLSIGLGIFAGCWWLGVRPHWPPREDQDRFLFALCPLLLAVELLAAFTNSENPSNWRRWLPWLLRLILAAIAGRILLHDSIYITDLSGPGSRQWTSEETWLTLGGLAAALIASWALLAWLAQRDAGRSVPVAVAGVCAAASVALMLSGYASGGPLAMPLAGAVVGALAASLLMKSGVSVEGMIGLSLVWLFALLIIGHFFGELTWLNAALLFFAPLLGWLPELTLRKLQPRLRPLTGLALTVIPVAVALFLAQQKFVENSAPPSADSQEPTLDDYMNFGK